VSQRKCLRTIVQGKRTKGCKTNIRPEETAVLLIKRGEQKVREKVMHRRRRGARTHSVASGVRRGEKKDKGLRVETEEKKRDANHQIRIKSGGKPQDFTIEGNCGDDQKKDEGN